MTTKPTTVPAKNHAHQGIPPLPFLHVSVDSTSDFLELRIITHRQVMVVMADSQTLNVSDYAVRHGLLGLNPNLMIIEKNLT